MIYAPIIFVTTSDNDVIFSMDVNMPVQPNLVAAVNLTGLSLLRFWGSSFAGITEYMKVGKRGVLVRIDTASGPFQCTPVVSDVNIDTLTWVLGAVNEAPGTVQAGLVILFVAPDGTFS